MGNANNSAVISGFAERFGGTALGGHAIASPLGVWLLLALLGPATEGVARRELEALLGTTVDDAASRAATLLGEPHPSVSALAAVWDRGLGRAFDRWIESVPGVVERGPVPTQPQADAWAHDRTGGAIAEFPLRIDELTRVVLASALTTDIAWAIPLGTSADLGGQFGAMVKHGLAFGHGLHLVAETAAAGRVAVTAPATSSALDVLSVIAAPGVDPHDVSRAAHRVAAMLGGDERAARRVPVDELPAQGHAWTVTERREQRAGGPQMVTEWRSHVPAWRMTGDHDLAEAPGIALVVDALTGFVREEERPVTIRAAQTAVAAYTRTGFTAAAVSALSAHPTGMPIFHDVLVRHVALRFNRPYAVLACAARDDGPPAWRGVPVFSAWVTEPREAESEGPPQDLVPVPVRSS